MADIQRTVEIIFGGKNEVSKFVDEIGQKFSQLDDLTSKITDPLAKVADSVLKTDATLAALAIGGMAYAIKQSSEFNKSFALISTSITAAGGDLTKYREDILTYSTTSVRSLEDINAALYTAAQAGIKYTDSLAFIRKSEELSVANNANLNTTVDLLTGTMNAYGFSVKDVGRMNDVFFQSTLIGKQTIDQLGQSLGNVVGIAANSGVGFEELNAAIATLTAKGMETPEAITAIKGVITAIISPSKEAADAAAKLGLNFSLGELKAKGFAGMLAEIMSKTGGSAEKMVTLFNEVRAMNGALSLTGDGMKFFNGALDETMHSAGASEKAYQKMVATFSNQSQMMVNAAKVMLITVGTELEPTAAKIAGSFGDLLKGIKIAVDAGAFDPLFKYLDEVGASIALWIKGIAAAMPDALKMVDFSGLIDAFRDLGAAMGEYLGGLDLTKADDLAGALQLLVDMVTGLVRVTTGMAEAFRPFANVIVDFFQTLSKGGPETQETIGKILLFSKAIETAGLLVVGAILAIDNFGISMRGLFDTVAGGTQVMWNGFEILLTAIKGMTIVVGGLFVELLDNLTFGMLPGLDTMKAKLTSWGETVEASFIKNGTEAAAGLSRLGDGLMRLGSESGTSKDKVAELRKGLTELPPETQTKINLTGIDESHGKVIDIKKAVTALPDLKEIGIKVLADGTTIDRAYGAIIKTFPDGQILMTNVGVEADAANLKAVKKKIDDAIPKDKLLEIQATLDVAKIKAQSDIIQHSIEWKAKLDIAQVEAETIRLKTVFDSINTSIESTGKTYASMVGSVASSVGTGTTSFIQSQIEAEGRRRDDALKLQKELITAEIDVLKKRAEALGKGEGIIKIESSNLAPHLEAFMQEILKGIQVKANSEGMKFLVGV